MFTYLHPSLLYPLRLEIPQVSKINFLQFRKFMTKNFATILFSLAKACKIYNIHNTQLFTWTILALIFVLINLEHWRIVKQIVQIHLVFVLLWGTATWTTPKAIKIGKMLSTAFNVTFFWELELEIGFD